MQAKKGSVALRKEQVICDLLQSELPVSLIRKAFKRLHYPIEIIAQCVRRYLAYALSLRNLEEMMEERGIEVDHSTLYR
ncbi:transposase [Xenorhabdus vietnamensis]|uniref:Transposase n=1 Tax=Xenorhabdus vietnamensis TaxID=351656 RepID=A0A1Y2S8V3_9GAMM|nr:transposase [Xenorhabdus vietnamensis]